MMTRYLSGLCVAGLGLCGGGWLVVAAVAFGGESVGLAERVNLLTGVVLIVVCCLSLACWSCAWRQRMRSDGVLADRFLLVSRREARRNRRALSRGVRRAGKVAERSTRAARRAARQSARAGGDGMLSGGRLGGGGLNGGDVLSAGVSLGSSSPADEPYSMAASHGTTAIGVNKTSANGVELDGVGANGIGANGIGASGSGRIRASGSVGDDAADLIGQLREMLAPLLAATGSQPALGAQSAAEATLPRRTPSASAFKPRSIPGPMPRAAATDDDGLGVPVDSEESWW
jgi:hypothetical protein